MVEPLTIEINAEDPQEGMRFESPETTLDFYNKYAKKSGFSIQCSAARRSRKDGSLITHEFVCSKQGEQNKKYEANQSQPYTRIGCQAMLRIKKDEHGIWFIAKHNKDHTHELTSPSKVHLLWSHRKIPKYTREMIHMYNSCRLTIPKITKVLSAQAGGRRSLPFVDLDCKNEIYKNRMKKSKLIGGDAEGLMEFFASKIAANPSFAYKMQVDADGHLTNILWVDAKSRIDCEFFGDVIIFDTTYKTNVYEMPCAPILRVNTKTIFLRCALLHKEDEESFTWLFTKWLEVMNGRGANRSQSSQIQTRECHLQ
ncbi:protein FAR1-RELATED SEQUENCE 5-like [Amborella trichopoda]|uniref:protein FAR1-RELATED SEQUENCE 5-like n=1 Tax=Amborella trichopoda TaxID=13333 RepID=UPI0009BF5A68|nr:protein FAR1-RELATED SEQUENCE 5-like [Amborella trichopoda]|eukprot:XP_020517918.1 protein FAR1-RELATED SEQUENCE 5-like [Amborella trichopoda]